MDYRDEAIKERGLAIMELQARIEALEAALREIGLDCPDWKYGRIAREALEGRQ